MPIAAFFSFAKLVKKRSFANRLAKLYKYIFIVIINLVMKYGNKRELFKKND